MKKTYYIISQTYQPKTVAELREIEKTGVWNCRKEETEKPYFHWGAGTYEIAENGIDLICHGGDWDSSG